MTRALCLIVGIAFGLGLGILEVFPRHWDNAIRFAALLALIAIVLWPSKEKDKK